MPQPRRGAAAAAPKNLTKTQLMGALADKTGLTKVAVEGVFSALEDLIRSELRRTGEISALPGLLKIKKAVKPARAAREGRNPATGETIMIAAQPASMKIKVTTLKTLKEMATQR